MTAVATVGVVVLTMGAGCQADFAGVDMATPGLLILALAACLEAYRQQRLPATLPLPAPTFALLLLVTMSMRSCGWGGPHTREFLQLAVLLIAGALAAGAMTPAVCRRGHLALAAVVGVNLVAALWQSLHPASAAIPIRHLYGVPWRLGGSGPDLAEEVTMGLMRSHLQYAALLCMALPMVLSALARWPARLRLPIGAAVCIAAAATVFPIQFLVLLAIGAAATLGHLAPSGVPLRLSRRIAMAACLVTVGAVLAPGRAPTPWCFIQPFTDSPGQPPAPKRLLLETAAAIHTVPRRLLGTGPGTYRHAIRDARNAAGLPRPVQNRVRRDSNSQYVVLAVESGPLALAALVAMFAAAVTASTQGTTTGPETAPDETARNTELKRNLQDRSVPAVSLIVAALAGTSTQLFTKGLGPGLALVLHIPYVGPPTSPRRPNRAFFATGVQALVLVGVLLLSSCWQHAPARAPAVPGKAAGVTRPQAYTDALVVEAEAASRISPEWAVRAANHTGGNRVVTIPEGIGNGVGSATYALHITHAGTYKLWLRVLWEDACSNAVLCRVAGAHSLSIEDAIFERWHWVDVAPRHTLELPSGTVSLVLENAEDGVHIDQIALLRNPNAVPLGILETGPVTDAGPAAETPAHNPHPAGPAVDFSDTTMPREDPFDRYGDHD